MREIESVRIATGLIKRLLDGEELDAPGVAELLNIERSTAKRYLDTIAASLPRVRVERKGATTFKIGRGRPSNDGTAVLALTLARAAMPALRGSELDLQLERLLDEQQQRVTAAHGIGDPGRRIVSLHRMMRDDRKHAKTVDELVLAVHQHRCISVSYQHFGAVGGDRCRLRPYSLLPTDHGLFCYAWVEDSDNIDHIDRGRMYKVARMTGLKVLPQTFAYPLADDYDPAKLFSGCFGLFGPSDHEPEQVSLEFAPDWAGYLACERLHPSQTVIEVGRDGWQRVGIRVHVKLDLVQWLRGLGDEVRILAPQRLADWVASRKGTAFVAPAST